MEDDDESVLLVSVLVDPLDDDMVATERKWLVVLWWSVVPVAGASLFLRTT
jgi:hypothetical protein